LKIELDDGERRAVLHSLVKRRGSLTEIVEDTTQTAASRRAGLLKLKLIASVLRKLRQNNGREKAPGMIERTAK
jgi:hypothetical protein